MGDLNKIEITLSLDTHTVLLAWAEKLELNVPQLIERMVERMLEL